jgi:hypothetical protein
MSPCSVTFPSPGATAVRPVFVGRGHSGEGVKSWRGSPLLHSRYGTTGRSARCRRTSASPARRAGRSGRCGGPPRSPPSSRHIAHRPCWCISRCPSPWILRGLSGCRRPRPGSGPPQHLTRHRDKQGPPNAFARFTSIDGAANLASRPRWCRRTPFIRHPPLARPLPRSPMGEVDLSTLPGGHMRRSSQRCRTR